MFYNSGISITMTLLVILTGLYGYMQKSSQFHFSVKIISAVSLTAMFVCLSLLIGFLEGEKFFQERSQIKRQFEGLQYKISHQTDSAAFRGFLVKCIENNEQSPWSNIAVNDFDLRQMKRVCMCAVPTPSGNAMPSITMELWPDGKEVPGLIRQFTNSTPCDRLVFELRGSNVDAVRLEYSGDRFDELLGKCKEKFKDTRQINPEGKMAVWKFVDEYYAGIMLVYFSPDDLPDEPGISKDTTYLIISALPQQPHNQ